MRTRQLRRALRAAQRGTADGIHDARVATRRLRELVPLLALGQPRARSLVRRLTRTGSRLGRLRDVDVQLAHVEALARAERGALPVLGGLRDELRRKAERRRARLVDAKFAERMDALDGQLRRAAEEVAAMPRARAREQRWATQARLVRRAADLREAVERAGALYQPDTLHRVRVAAKKLRYTLEVAGATSSVRHAADLRLLVRTQGVLGRQHDAQALLDAIAALHGETVPESVVAWSSVARLSAVLDGRCHTLHGRYLRACPALLSLCARLESPEARGSRVGRKAS